jgi:hypothetical protein
MQNEPKYTFTDNDSVEILFKFHWMLQSSSSTPALGCGFNSEPTEWLLWEIVFSFLSLQVNVTVVP